MSDDQIISAAITLAGVVMAFASVKTDTSWIKKTLDEHLRADEKRFEKINEKLEQLK